MEKRVLLAVFLSFLVLYGYQALFPPPKPLPAGTSQAARPAAGAAAAGVPGTTRPGVAASCSRSRRTRFRRRFARSPGDAKRAERTVTVDTADVTAVFTNRGAQILSWRLKHYNDDHGRPVDLVPAGLPRDTPRPFALRAEDPAITARLNSAFYKATDAMEPPRRIASR